MMHYEKNYTGNARFYGFCVDLLERVSREVGFDYILDLVPDRKYGAQDPLTGEWNGMVLQLMKHVGSRHRWPPGYWLDDEPAARVQKCQSRTAPSAQISLIKSNI